MLKRRLAYWLGSAEREAALREEMELHIEEVAAGLREQGRSEADARAEARRRFGNFGAAQESSRQVWIARRWSELWQDLRYAARGLKRDPGFTAVAVLSAALGIGACTTVFSIVNFALFRPLPVAEPERLLAITGIKRGMGGGSMSYPEFRDVGLGARAFEGVAAFTPFVPAGISAAEGARRYWGFMVAANYFDVVRPSFALGRGFVAVEDDVSGAPAKIVITHALWRSAFRADPEIVGKTIHLNKRGMVVAGVTGPGFRGTDTGIAADFFLPFSQLSEIGPLKDEDHRARMARYESQWVTAVGRLRPGVGVRQAQAELDAVAAEIRTRVPNRNPDRRFHAEPTGQVMPLLRRIAVPVFMLLLGVTILVLLTACANVANLLLARASARQNEIAARMALGAGRGRLVRQLLTESLLLALMGGALGVGLAEWAGQHIGSFRLPLPMPVDLTPVVDHRVAAFAAALAVITGLAFGLAPALRVTRSARLTASRFGAGNVASLRRFGLRNALVVAQIALSTVLVVSSGLFLRSLGAAESIDSGMDPRNVALVRFDPALSRYDEARTQRLILDLLRDAESAPGVKSASVANMLPLSLASHTNRVWREGSDGKTGEQAGILSVGPRYFETAGTRLEMGEDFRAAEYGEPVAIINQELARRLYPGENPLGRRVANAGRWARIIGVAANTKYRMLQESEAMPMFYEPILTSYAANGSLDGVTMIIRSRQDPAALGEMVRKRIRSHDPELVINSIGTMEGHLREALFLPRLAASLFGFCGGMGLLIASIGVYGVISFSVARRRREIGIRMAVGGKTRDVVLMVMRHGVGVTLIGVTLGLVGGFMMARVAGSLLYGVSASDPLAYIGAGLVLTLAGLLATAFPARRAALVEPNEALRAE
ncbi:MAG TPA: ABC transporter permease [Bryobacteraceae bacterium]|nr:ABC transporter permease [Bryobacteraceae bacterium]